MKIYIGTDHNGFALKNSLVVYLRKAGYEVIDSGEERLNPEDDFPIFAQRVVNEMLTSEDKEPMGILLCGSGQGMCMAANRFKGIRAALGYDRESVRSSRNDDDANVLCLPARHLEKDATNVLVETFLNTPFSHVGKYQRRIREIDDF
ncbi:RpiB/LacA/LacB family sugar-phosphate isomerase [Candidatus Saccharibacteria bacterium]|nr:RpiB/LacA/LacB family sugar-phosphate isomerase [Candidatus Saccharibacteria bacterium]